MNDRETELYEQYRGLLLKVCKTFAFHRHIDASLCVSIAHPAMVRAMRTHNEEELPFAAWMATCVNNELAAWWRNEGRWRQDWASMVSPHHMADRKGDITQLMVEISDDARTVAEVALNVPLEKRSHRLVRRPLPLNWIAGSLRDLGWTAARIAEGISELKEALS